VPCSKTAFRGRVGAAGEEHPSPSPLVFLPVMRRGWKNITAPTRFPSVRRIGRACSFGGANKRLPQQSGRGLLREGTGNDGRAWLLTYAYSLKPAVRFDISTPLRAPLPLAGGVRDFRTAADAAPGGRKKAEAPYCPREARARGIIVRRLYH
jgi:hypothetical protein